MDIEGLQRLFDWLVSRRTILWIFASSVFGAYVVSLEAALLESVDYYGPMRVFTTAQLANMVLPGPDCDLRLDCRFRSSIVRTTQTPSRPW